jgi:hypothetical protein
VNWHASEFDLDFKFNDDVTRRVNGFFVKSNNGHGGENPISLDPDEVTVTWDMEADKATKSLTFALDFQDRNEEIYFDLPDMDVTDLRFTFRNPFGITDLTAIELFGPSAAAVQTGKDEIANGDFSTENWWVFTEELAGEAEECVKASRTTTTSGYYVASSVMDVPKSECCQAGTTLEQAQLKLACPAV